ncbi:MAG: hypothetical protein ABSD99_01400 [Candidatus Bathyarchaeia archaeon]|jgi:DNA polymerase-2
MWLKKPQATGEEYKRVCEQIGEELDIPISFEGRYKWIVFLNSRIDTRVPVLNRYYGVFEDGTLKVRGIDLRRHDTPEIVRKCQAEMLSILSKADNSDEFRELVPRALSDEALRITSDERQRSSQRISDREAPQQDAQRVDQSNSPGNRGKASVREGSHVHPGQNISFVISHNDSGIADNRALPVELADETTPYDAASYVELILSSALNLFLPFGFDLNTLRAKTQ